MSFLTTLLGANALHHLADTAAKRASLATKLAPAATTHVITGDLTLAEGEDRCFDEATLHVQGNLVLDEQARLLVAGDLIVDGNIVHEGFDYALLFVGGTLRAANLLFHGEVVALRAITLRGVAWTYYNDYSTYADTLAARAVIADDRMDAIDHIDAPTQLTDRHDALARALPTLLRDGILDADSRWSYPDLARRLRAGESLLREG